MTEEERRIEALDRQVNGGGYSLAELCDGTGAPRKARASMRGCTNFFRCFCIRL